MAGTYLHPGVYIEEVPGGARPIEAVGTSTAAFIGIAERGPTNEARFITNFTEFEQIYGWYVRDSDIGTSYLAYSVNQFFQNGGRSCYVVRVEDQATTAKVDLFNDGEDKTMTITAVSPGSWGNGLRIGIDPGTTAPDERFNMYVYIKDELKESYEDISMVDTDLFYVDRVTKRSLYIRTESESLPDGPVFLGKKTGPFPLNIVKKIKLTIDSFGPYVIDCAAGALSPPAVTATEVCNNINQAFRNNTKDKVAFDQGGRVKIVSPTADKNSIIRFSNPADKDASYDIFGLQEYSWKVTGKEEKIALALGRETAALMFTHLAGGEKISLAFGTPPYKDITLAKKAEAVLTLFGIITDINTAFPGTAYTDGMHVILKSSEDIYIKRTNASLIFGDFYSYHFKGANSDPAKIEGPAGPTIGDGQLRIKIDDYPFLTITLKSGDTAVAVADKINASFQKAAKSKKTVADATGDRLTLSSLATGEAGRIIVANPTGAADATTAVLGAGLAATASDFFLIPAEMASVAKVTGEKDLNAGMGTLPGKKLRFGINDETPVQLTVATASDNIQKLFGNDFANAAVSGLNYHILTSGRMVDMIAVSRGTAAELYFSFPLKSGLETEEADVSVNAQAAYAALFGDTANQGLFTANAAPAGPVYNYEVKSQDNRPARNPDSVPLLGGGEDRTSENKLRDLTVGAIGENGVRRLDRLTDVNMLVIPGWEKMSVDVATTFVNEGTAYCNNVRPAQARPLRDLFFVTQTPASVTKSEDARDYAQQKVTKSAGGYTAIYYPWVTVNDPIGTKSPTISVPPSGMVAGLYASIDGRRGVWKAPAGTEAGLAGVVSLADQVSDIKQDLLNPFGVNAIRRMPGAGIVSWGARTLATNPEWKYIPVRRMAIMMEVSIYEGIQWAVFEPNDGPLWSLLRLNINAFMMNLFRNGAFQGATPDDAFFVKCDGETTTQIDIDLGKVNILVGFAPLKPAEFVIVKISQKAGKKD
jgi:phage tail sheath protein FI